MTGQYTDLLGPSVALRKESVDRNPSLAGTIGLKTGSLSARRAWIEIVRPSPIAKSRWVALRKESVDRNMRQVMHIHAEVPSLSARRAWIEMVKLLLISSELIVALRKESVDRNRLGQILV